jgi:hypothetical protein
MARSEMQDALDATSLALARQTKVASMMQAQVKPSPIRIRQASLFCPCPISRERPRPDGLHFEQGTI